MSTIITLPGAPPRTVTQELASIRKQLELLQVPSYRLSIFQVHQNITNILPFCVPGITASSIQPPTGLTMARNPLPFPNPELEIRASTRRNLAELVEGLCGDSERI